MAIPDAFEPHPLLRGGHAQTLAGQLLGGKPRVGAYDVETVDLGDGDRVLLHVNAPIVGRRAMDDASKPIVILLHGLGGCSESTYVLRITAKLNALGYTSVRFNHRGCGRGGAALARQIYHAGRIEDVETLLRHAGKRWPGRPLLIAAFSLSANILLRYLGEREAKADAPRAQRTLAVCPPVDLERCSFALDRRDNWHIDQYFTRRLIREAAKRHKLFPDTPNVRFPARTTLRLFDEIYTAPFAGFPSREVYYSTSSARHSVDKITTPTTILAAADDPIIPPSSFEGVPFSPAVSFRMERGGGHMGFVSARRTAYGDRRWMDAFVVSWVRRGF